MNGSPDNVEFISHLWLWMLTPLVTGVLGYLTGSLLKKSKPCKMDTMAASQLPVAPPPDDDEVHDVSDTEVQYKVWAMVEQYDPVTEEYEELYSPSESAAVLMDEDEAHDLVDRMTQFGRLTKHEQDWLLAMVGGLRKS